jgi:hypothetical protein
MQYQPPQGSYRLDDARIPKKLGKIATHGRRRWRVGRAEINKKDSQGLGEPVLVGWR